MNLWKLFLVTVSVVPLSLCSYRSIRFLGAADTAVQVKKIQDAKVLRGTPSDSSGTSDLPLFILHVGPRNTGAATIQWFASNYKQKLMKDNFFFLGHNSSSNEWNTHQLYIDCIILMQDYDTRFCNRKWENFERDLEKHRSKNHNVFVSDELFSSFTDTHNVEQEHLWNMLVPRLEKKWRVRVIFSYRRYYASIYSRYAQFFNPDKFDYGEMVEMWPSLGGKKIPSFPEFFDAVEKESFKHPVAIKERWEERFDVEVFNVHSNEENFVKNFFCQMLPEAVRTCRFIQKNGNGWEIPRTPSISVAHEYEMLTVAAYRRGWISNSRSPYEVVNAVESYAKTHSYENVACKCLSPAKEETLLKMSLSMEQQMVPEFYGSSIGEDLLRSEFRKASKSGLFCSIDADAILEDDGWKQVFETFESAPIPSTVTDGAEATESKTASHSSAIPIDYPQLKVDISWLGIGAQGAGTTWLSNMLTECCPTVALPIKKEVHFWDWYRQKGLGWYSQQWEVTGEPSKRFHGEFSPHYMSLPDEDIREIRALFPSVRLIFVARDLVERTWSGIRKTVRRDSIHGDVDTIDPSNYTDDFFMKRVSVPMNLERSSYDVGMKRWYAHFPEDQILILNFDDIAVDPSGLIRQVLNHIGVPNPDSYLKKIEEKEGEKINPGVYTDIRPSLRKKLEDLFRPHSKAFNALLRKHGYTWFLNEYE